MDWYSRRVLWCMMKCQYDSDMGVYVDFEKHCFCTVHDGSTPKRFIRSACFLMSGDRVSSVLRHLEEQGFITANSSASYILNHTGFLAASGKLWRFLRFLIFSVLVPAFVAYFTSAFAYFDSHDELLIHSIIRYIETIIESLSG